MQTFRILSVNLSERKGTGKTPVPQIRLVDTGVENDIHSGISNLQVSLLAIGSIERFSGQTGRETGFGECGENITLSGSGLGTIHLLDRLTGEDTELLVTQFGKDCSETGHGSFRGSGTCILPSEGVFCRVVRGGFLRPGMDLTHHPKVFNIHIITLSDRASRGEYEDRSGPLIRDLCHQFLTSNGRIPEIRNSLIADDPGQLTNILSDAREHKADVIITTGGTGIGPRDHTPETVRPMLDKEIPGIMEMIRVKYGAGKPNALISRGVAGVMGQSLVFTLPGSMKAVKEYMEEILKSLLHMIYMLHGLDRH